MMDTLKRGLWYRTASGSERDKDATFPKAFVFNHGDHATRILVPLATARGSVNSVLSFVIAKSSTGKSPKNSCLFRAVANADRDADRELRVLPSSPLRHR